ncbi:MAG: amidophosphoribosyltransferase [Alphaproteobacteria bacterium]|nr:MAG: amidophosphoribosyltransferase [Alphaproteobacteria bacterium]
MSQRSGSEPPAGKRPLSTHPFMGEDRLREECGIFGIFGTKDAAAHTALGLHALQHRGQEAAGITAFNGRRFHTERAMGLVGDHFTRADILERLSGHAAIGHVRYSTTGETVMRNVQPLFADLATTGFAIAHNGNLTNALALRRELVRQGAIFQSTTDTEVILHLVATSRFPTLLDKLIDALRQVEGAYSLVALWKGGLIGLRDPYGVRPLVLGRLGDAWVLASETCALDIIGAEYLRDVEPGEIVAIDEKGIISHKPFPRLHPRPCIFEHVYFARPDSYLDGMSVYAVRKRIGAELAREAPVEADIVVPVPDSGVPAAIGYAEASGIPFELGIIRNHYVGRTFIEPADHIRHLGVKLKHNANRWYIAGKRVVLVDDSIVRGTTSLKIVDMVRQAGASEVHMRIASPPTRHSCFYGVDTPERDKLLAARMSVEEMRQFIHADSLAFLSIDGLYRACNVATGRNAACPAFCDACFTGDYPIRLTDVEECERRGAQLPLLSAAGE